MKSNSKQLKQVLNRFPKVKRYLLDQDSVIFAYIFGSVAKGKEASFSDIDIAVYVANTNNLEKIKLLILGDLADILEKDRIDLVILNSASLVLKAQVLKHKIILVDKKPFLRHKFESLALREYFDFSVKERDIYKRRYSIG